MKFVLIISLVMLSAYSAYAGVEKCHQCDPPCTDVTEVTCKDYFELDWLCGETTFTFRNGTSWGGKGCLPKRLLGKGVCDIFQEAKLKQEEITEVECTTCESDLCN